MFRTKFMPTIHENPVSTAGNRCGHHVGTLRLPVMKSPKKRYPSVIRRMIEGIEHLYKSPELVPLLGFHFDKTVQNGGCRQRRSETREMICGILHFLIRRTNFSTMAIVSFSENGNEIPISRYFVAESLSELATREIDGIRRLVPSRRFDAAWSVLIRSRYITSVRKTHSTSHGPRASYSRKYIATDLVCALGRISSETLKDFRSWVKTRLSRHPLYRTKATQRFNDLMRRTNMRNSSSNRNPHPRRSAGQKRSSTEEPPDKPIISSQYPDESAAQYKARIADFHISQLLNELQAP